MGGLMLHQQRAKVATVMHGIGNTHCRVDRDQVSTITQKMAGVYTYLGQYAVVLGDWSVPGL